MKKKINLLTSHEDRTLLLKKLLLMRLIVIISSIFSVILFCFILFISYKQNGEMKQLYDEKEKFMKEIVKMAEKEKKLEKIEIYSKQLEKLLNSDINFLPYYRILADSLNASTESAQLSSISIDNKKNVTMKLTFNSYDSMLSFINSLQSKEFLDKFSSLNLESFTLNEKSSSKANYTLLIKGAFKPISYSLL